MRISYSRTDVRLKDCDVGNFEKLKECLSLESYGTFGRSQKLHVTLQRLIYS